MSDKPKKTGFQKWFHNKCNAPDALTSKEQQHLADEVAKLTLEKAYKDLRFDTLEQGKAATLEEVTKKCEFEIDYDRYAQNRWSQEYHKACYDFVMKDRGESTPWFWQKYPGEDAVWGDEDSGCVLQ